MELEAAAYRGNFNRINSKKHAPLACQNILNAIDMETSQNTQIFLKNTSTWMPSQIQISYVIPWKAQ